MVGRKAALALGLTLVLAVGCGDGGGETSSTTSTTLSELDCPGPIAIASTADLVEVLADITWEGLGEYTSGLLSITPDLVVSGTVVLEAADLPIPADCLARPDCSPQGGFWIGAPVPGVVAGGDAPGPCVVGFARLTLTDTTIRLRPTLYDTHPCQYNFVPFVEVVGPCGSPCGPDAELCPYDGACYRAGATFCRLCEGGSKEDCACQGSEGPLEEGASCTYWVSGDVQCVGACRQGACESANSLCR
jgi:hypothetical protein